MANDHKGMKFTGYTALSGTTSPKLGAANLKLPDKVKTILGIVPYLTSPAANTANEPIAGKVHIISESVKINPLIVLSDSRPVTAGGSQLRAHAGCMLASYCCAQAGCGSGICARMIKSPAFPAEALYLGSL